MAKIFDFDSYSLVNKAKGTAITNNGSTPFIMTKKGRSASFNGTSQYLTHPAITGNYNTILFNLYFPTAISTASSYPFSSLDSSSGLVAFGNAQGGMTNETFAFWGASSSNGTYITSTINAGWNQIIMVWNGTTYDVYLNGLKQATTNIGTGCEQLNGLISLGKRQTQAQYFKGYIKDCKIWDNVLSTKELNKEYQDFINEQPLSTPTTLSRTQSVIDFEQNITNNNYVQIPDNDTLDMGTGAFSVYWEDTYPQRQVLSYATVLGKGRVNSSSPAQPSTWGMSHNATSPNGLMFVEKDGASAVNRIAVLSNIPNGYHKFLLVREVSPTPRITFYCNGVMVSQTNNSVIDFTNTYDFWIKGFSGSVARSTGYMKNLKIWKGQVLNWSQATSKYKTGLVLDLPMDEGQGTIVYDRSGNNNNGAITSTFPLANWTKKSFPLDKKVIDWKFDRADGTNITPKDFIKGTGSYKLVTATTDQGNYGGLKKGDNYLECTVAGTLATPSKWAYGTVEFDLYKGADANSIQVNLISSIGLPTPTINYSLGYRVILFSNEDIRFSRITGVAGATDLMLTATSYIANSTWYRIKITRSITGVFTIYIKGGAFGTSYTLVSVSGGSGANPVTDTTYTTSNFLVSDLDSGDRIGKIIQSSQIY